ncbi:MAG: ATP-binding cassette domain-containing protein [Deltaproteobacteria bacterium]|nr:ATP-binding cassette domain-containing protein [Deltaproteobacteria bacterium]
MAYLSVDHASFHEAGHGSVGPIDVVVEPGQIVLAVGGEGSGKTVLLRGCLGLAPPRGGRVCLFDQDLAGLDHDAMMSLRGRCALASAAAPLMANQSLFDNIALPLWMRGAPGAAHIVGELLERLELTDVATRRPDDVLPRARDLALLARALAVQADLYLLDEPPVSPAMRGLLHARIDAGAAALITVRHEALFPEASRRVLLGAA